MFTWGTNTVSEAHADLPAQLWDRVPQPKHLVKFKESEHFDYLYKEELACRPPRGSCPHVGAFTTDTVTMFFARFLQPEQWPRLAADIAASLIPPTTAELAQRLTPEQQSYLGGYLAGVPAFEGSSNCGIASRESPPPPIAGQLLFYRDHHRDGAGEATPRQSSDKAAGKACAIRSRASRASSTPSTSRVSCCTTTTTTATAPAM